MSLKSQIITRRELFAAAGVGATAYWLKMPLARAVEEPPPADPYLVLRVPGAVKPFSFAHLSDIHLCAADERDSDEIQEYMKMRARVAFGETPNQMAQQVFEKVNQWKPDFVAITGDFIDYPALACIELGGKLLEMLDAPCWHAVGNHDWWEMDPPGARTLVHASERGMGAATARLVPAAIRGGEPHLRGQQFSAGVALTGDANQESGQDWPALLGFHARSAVHSFLGRGSLRACGRSNGPHALPRARPE
ncbi:MAG: metallophosphoesterase family protein [Pirellulaceae bacterium]